MKLKAKGREKSHGFNFFLVEGLIVAWGKFRASPVILWRKMQLTFILTCFAKYDFLVDFFVVTNQANYQDCSGIYNWGRHCISWSYTRTPRFLYLRTAFGHLSCGNFCQSVSLLNKVVLSMIFQFAGDVFSDRTHHGGFHFSPFTDLLCWYMVIIQFNPH